MINMNRRELLASAGAAAALSGLPTTLAIAKAAAKSGPPVARIEPVTDTYFGVSVTDPYRWMENPKDKDWEPFMQGQPDSARKGLGSIPGRDAIAKRVGELSGDLEIVSGLAAYGPYTFIEKRPAGANNYQLYVRDASGTERLLVDPEARTQGDVHYALNYWS